VKKLREENDRGRVVLERLLAVLKEAKDAFPWPNCEANPGGHRLRVLLEEIGYDSRDGQVPAPLLDDVPSLNPLAGEVLALCQNICGRTVIEHDGQVDGSR
jgi:hypothetical protein